tara:strand:+ start:5405 stop:8197 length:2793 start_codon:yes stop_codon:yes gene_type:complete
MSNFKAYISNDVSGSFWEQSNDEFRNKLEAFWGTSSIANTVTPIQPGQQNPAGGGRDLEELLFWKNMVLDQYSRSTEGSSYDVYKTTETITLKNDKGNMSNASFESFINSLIPGYYFTDCTFFTSTPSTDLSAESEAAGTLELLRSDFDYNFLEPSYESYISNRIKADRTTLTDGDKTEREMPNLYGYYIARTTNNFEKCGNRCFAEKNITNYMLSDNAAAYNMAVNKGYYKNNTPSYYQRVYRNVVFSVDNADVVTSAPSLISSFPMYTKISWPSYEDSEFVRAIQDAQLNDDLMTSIVDAYDDLYTGADKQSEWDYMSQYRIIESQAVASQYADTADLLGITETGSLSGDVNLPYLNVMGWLKTMEGSDYFGVTNLKIKKIKGDDEGRHRVAIFMDEGFGTITDEMGSGLNSLLKSIIFQGKLKKIVKDNFRTWKDLVEGGTCHSETVLYRIVKRSDDGTASTPIQTIWIPNFPGLNITEYIDTQVGYDVDYYYKVSAFKLVVGSKYTYAAKILGIPEPPPPVVEEDVFAGVFTEESIGGFPDGHSHQYEVMSDGDGKTISVLDEGDNHFGPIRGHEHSITYKYSVPEIEPMDDHGLARKDQRSDGHYHLINLQEYYAHVAAAGSGNPSPGNGQVSPSSAPATTADIEDLDLSAEIVVTTVPYLKLIECEYPSFNGNIVDSPPVAPNIDIIPYKGVNNKLMINFNTSVGEYELDPIIILDEDQVLIDHLRKSKKLLPDSPILYKTDDIAKNFEIFRMTTPPLSYSDFANNFRSAVSTQIKGDQYASGVSYEDLVSSNTVYYYMFRTVDFHGYNSNPSPVYKVELVETDGAVYPLVEIYDDFDIFPTYQFSRQFQKLISIVPQYTQAIVKTRLDSDGNALESVEGQRAGFELGIDQEKLFGQNFKIRLVSKKTGRKIDFNLSFKIKQPV